MQGTETVQIVPAAARDGHGDPIGGAADPITIEGAITWPRTSTEEGRGEVIIDGLNVFLPPGSPQPAAKGQMVARGKTWEVDGVPGLYLKGGREKGTLVVLKSRTT